MKLQRKMRTGMEERVSAPVSPGNKQSVGVARRVQRSLPPIEEDGSQLRDGLALDPQAPRWRRRKEMENAVGEIEVKIADWSVRLNADSAVAECQRTTTVNEIEGEQAIAFSPDMKHPGVGLILADRACPALAPGWLAWA